MTALVENLNYSAPGLLANFPNEFNEEEAQQYAHNPPMIANRVCANRNGNGDEASGDGWLFRGRGMGITGRRNYQLCGVGIGVDLVAHPELLEQPGDAALASAWYWFSRKFNVLADAGNFLDVWRAVNLGSATSTGTPGSYSQRLALYGAAKQAPGIA
jgi:putative chitinase